MNTSYRIVKHGTKMIDYFDNLGAFLEYTDPAVWRRLPDRYFPLTLVEEFSGYIDLNGAHETARIGMAFTPQMHDFRDRLASSIAVAQVQQGYWDVSGSGEIDIGAYLNGEPECVMNYTQDTGKARIKVSLLLEVSARCGVSQERLATRGVAYMALIDALEKSGRYSVQLYVIAATDTCAQAPVIKLKSSSEQYDPNALAFAIAHPGFFRRLIFASFDRACHEGRRDARASWHRGYSHAYNQVTTLPTEIEDGAVYAFSGSYDNLHEFATEATAERWVRDTLESFGVHTSQANQ